MSYSDEETTRLAWQSAMPLFERWIDADEAQRTMLLADLAANKPDVHVHLLKLIAADGAAEGAHFLDADALSDTAPANEQELLLGDLVGTQIGAWRLERLLGIGGTGQVWLARRCDGLHAGKAAVKLLRAAAIEPHAQQRFAREGRLLARLEHAHIARLLDVGENAQGQRYLVLEHVDGDRIDRWCDQHNANIDARLRLFLQVCDAVGYAHANLIVHRDLKPSNILVQADGDAKLLDFGVAKLLGSEESIEGPASEATELTRIGGAAFTPEYAAPEQFERQPATVTTDVYSLGVVLYVMLAGRRPYGSEQSSPMQLARAILDSEPRRLSLTLNDQTQDTERIARARSTTPEHLRRVLRGDLETIIARALKKDPKERYPSVQAFADDVQRYLDHRPILARADSATYRVRKFARRHWIGLGASALIVLAVVAGMIGVIRAEQSATREATRAQAVQQFLIGLFQEADPVNAQGENRTVRDLLERGEHDLRDKLASEPETKLTLLGVLGNIHDQLGDSRKSIELAQTARDLAAREYGVHSLEYADALNNLANYQKTANDITAAEKNYAQVREIFSQHRTERAKELALMDAYLAYIYAQTDRNDEALALWSKVLPEIGKQFGEQSWELAEQKSLLAGTYTRLHREADAIDVYTALTPLLDAASPEHALDVAVIRANEGYTLWVAGRMAECEAVLRRAVSEFDRLDGPDNNYSVSALRTLGSAYMDAGDYAKAAATFDDMVARAARAFGADTPEFAINQSFRVGTLILTGHATEAEAVMRPAFDNAQHKAGLTPSEVRGVERRYALSLIWSGNGQKARDLLVDIAKAEREANESPAKLASTLLYLAGAQIAMGQAAQARASAHEAAELDASVAKSTEQGVAQLTEALALAASGGAPAAVALMDQAQTNLRTKLAPGHPKFLIANIARAQVLRAAGQNAEGDAIDASARAELMHRTGVVLPPMLPMVF